MQLEGNLSIFIDLGSSFWGISGPKNLMFNIKIDHNFCRHRNSIQVMYFQINEPPSLHYMQSHLLKLNFATFADPPHLCLNCWHTNTRISGLKKEERQKKHYELNRTKK